MPALRRTVALAATLALNGALVAACDPPPPAAPGQGSGASAVPEPEPREDREDRVLATAVLVQLATDPDVDATHFTVEAESGVVRVGAEGASPAEWARARALAAATPGVTEVVMSDPAPTDGSAADAAASAAGPTAVRDLEQAFAEASRMGTATAEPWELPVADGSGDASIAQAASGARPRTYVVQPGDSLSIIAQRTLGDGLAWPRIYELNRSMIGPNPQALQAGMELRIPQD